MMLSGKNQKMAAEPKTRESKQRKGDGKESQSNYATTRFAFYPLSFFQPWLAFASSVAGDHASTNFFSKISAERVPHLA